MFTIEQIFRFEFDFVAIQKLDVLFFERFDSVMYLLIPDIFDNGIDEGITDCEHAKPLLPCEFTVGNVRFMNPFGRACLDVANGIGEGEGWRDSGEDVNVICHATDFDQTSLLGPNDPADVFIESFAEFQPNRFEAIFGGEDNVVIQFGERTQGGLLASDREWRKE